MPQFMFIAATATGYGALVKKASDLTSYDSSSGATLTWDTEVYDNGGWHDTGSNTDRLTVPAGVAYIMAAGQVRIANSDINIQQALSIYKNNSVMAPLVRYEDTTSEQMIAHVATPPLPVNAEDYFTLPFLSSDTSLDIVAADSWFAIWKVG